MDQSKILITGSEGQLGKALQQQYPKAKTADIDDLDITDPKSVEAFNWDGIEYLINAAAFTNVDGAETSEGRVAAWKVNADAVANLVAVAAQKDITMVHVSTDYVFDGSQDNHTEDEPFSPLSVYGASKAAGDLLVGMLPKHYILRTSWVIGDGKNFVRTMLGLGQKGIEPTVVSDQIGRLTFTSTLVGAIDHLLSSDGKWKTINGEVASSYGTYNVTNAGEPASWADITRKIFDIADYSLKVSDTSTEEYFKGKEDIAPRPLNSTLDLSRIESTGFFPTDWKEDLASYISEEMKQR